MFHLSLLLVNKFLVFIYFFLTLLIFVYIGILKDKLTFIIKLITVIINIIIFKLFEV